MTDPLNSPRDDAAAAALRVNLTLLDTLMNLAGELVLSRNQLLQSVKAEDMKGIALSSQRIDLITSELQEAIMHTRMQPIDTILSSLPGLAEGWAESGGKVLEFTVRGNEVELDKTILESLHGPLRELLRHLVDLSIEPPEKRMEQGLPAAGRIFVAAEHDAGQVNITLADDTPGLAPDAVLAWAVARGLVTEEAAAGMSDRQKLELIATSACPGKEGAEGDTATIASVVESMGGTLEVKAVAGSGTRIRVKLPLTLAIIPSQIAAVGRERYALPQVNLNELIRIPAAQAKERIEKVGDAAVVRLRGALLPLLDLAGLLDIRRRYTDPATGELRAERRKNIADRRSRQLLRDSGGTQTDPGPRDRQERAAADRRTSQESAIHIAVVSAGAYRYGLVVDRFLDAEEIVVKPMGRHMKGCEAYAGATIMGDGRVALILDISNLAAMASLSTTEETRNLEQKTAGAGAADTTELILFKNGETEHLCVPQDRVARLERIRTADIEEIGNARVIQYRGGSLPLFFPAQVADVGPLPEKEDREVLVLKAGEREIGLMVTPPVDTVAVALEVDTAILAGGAVAGSAVIKEKTTLVLDVDRMVEILKPE